MEPTPLDKRVKVLSITILSTLGLGLTAVIVGGLADILGNTSLLLATIMGSGFVLMSVSVLLAHWMRVMPMLRPRRGSVRDKQIRQWQILKSVSILLNLLAILSLAILVFAVLVRGGTLRYEVSTALVLHVPSLLAMSLAIVSAAAFLQSMRTPLDPDTSLLARIMHGVAVAGIVGSALWGILAARLVLGDGVADGFTPGDHAMMFLASGLFLAIDLFIDRPLPTIYVLLSEEKEVYSGHRHFSRSKSVIAPTLGAFSLLFLVFLIFVAFSGGIGNLWARVIGDASFLVALIFIVLALIGSGVGSVIIARSPDKVYIFQATKNPEDVLGRNILIGSIVAAFGIALVATAMAQGANVFNIPEGRWTDILALAILVGLGPYGFYIARRAKRTRRMEERFPDFLRDLASSHSGGLTLPNAVAIAARGDYGALSAEVSRMADQMSWNVSFREALQRFGDRVRTPLVERAVNLILEADRSGGSTSDVLLAAARDARQIKTLENERGLSMSLYTIVIYITFGVFLLVAAVMYGQFVPEIVRASEALGEDGFGAAAATIDTVSLPQYRAFYYIAGLSQAIGSGIIAGMMGTGKALLGLRHSFLMVASVAFLFLFLQ